MSVQWILWYGACACVAALIIGCIAGAISGMIQVERDKKARETDIYE